MAEAEDVIVDAARHATIYARALWQRYRPPAKQAAPLGLADVAPRLDLLITALCGRSLRLRVAQPPAPPSLLALAVHRRHGPVHRHALPATDGESIWMPASFGNLDAGAAWSRYRVLALTQAVRVMRGSASSRWISTSRRWIPKSPSSSAKAAPTTPRHTRWSRSASACAACRIAAWRRYRVHAC